MKESLLYKIIRPIIKTLFIFLFTPKIIGNEKIPKESKIVLAGNHTNILDCLLLISSTKRNIHFLAKQELFKGPFSPIFKNLGLIPVNRKTKSPNSLILANKYLNSNKIICIFPEGTIGKNGLLPFKYGAVKMANDSNSPIIPFVITGKYKLFSRTLKIEFLDSITISNDLTYENNRLRNLIKKHTEV